MNVKCIGCHKTIYCPIDNKEMCSRNNDIDEETGMIWCICQACSEVLTKAGYRHPNYEQCEWWKDNPSLRSR